MKRSLLVDGVVGFVVAVVSCGGGSGSGSTVTAFSVGCSHCSRSYTPQVGSHAPSQSRESIGRSSTTPTQQWATTYFPSDWVEDETEDGEASNGSATTRTIPHVLSTQAWTAPLARLAAGHWDGGASLKMEHIEQVSVRAVASSHVDIEAIVCEADGCVSVSVPVPFVQPCGWDSSNNNSGGGGSFGAKFEECILRNMQLLDDKQLQVSDGVLTHDELTALRSTEEVEYPSWWVHSPSMAFANECNTLLTILNEPDFETDLVRVVQHEMRVILGRDNAGNGDGADNDLENDIVLQKAAVAAVGPAGLVLRAYAIYQGEAEMVHIPVPFATFVTDVSQMSEAVLECVESIPPQSP